MATYFEITIAGRPETYARQAAAAAWRELERLESELSQFVEGSDIARANRIARDETIPISHDTLECLLRAADLTIATQRAFDPTYASVLPDGYPRNLIPFTLDPDEHTLTSRVDRLLIDLGAIGKGYALDRMAEVLREWNVTSATLNGGGSTVLALDPPPAHAGWPMRLTENRGMPLTHEALSASGVIVKGQHLINPRTGEPAERRSRTWALARDAATADALSTAFFVMSETEVTAFCARYPDFGGAFIGITGELLTYGTLKQKARP